MLTSPNRRTRINESQNHLWTGAESDSRKCPDQENLLHNPAVTLILVMNSYCA